jgi:hypothetical protein
MIFAYLIGRRRAILEIAANRKALVVAALLVLSAALARNYDRASLMHEPWRLLGPFVASLAISGPLFLIIYGFAQWKGMESPGIGRAYVAFLALYWMTAPLAWFYGIPYERFLSPLGATKANLWTLALVSIWRVALLIQVVSVVFDLPLRTALALVMLVADIAALAALYLVPLPVIHVMGGISAEQETVAFIALLVTLLCWAALPLLIGLAAAVARSTRNRPVWRVPSTSERPAGGVGALAFAGLTLIGWTALLPFTQREQILAHRVEQAYRRSGPTAALAMISAHRRIDFPPDWQPPPRTFPGEPPISEVINVLDALAGEPRARWIGDLYSRRFRDRVRFDPFEWPEELLTKHAVRLAAVLTRLPEGPEMARALQYTYPSIDSLLERDRLEPHPILTEDQRAALDTLRRLAGEGKVEPTRAAAVADPGQGAKPHE